MKFLGFLIVAIFALVMVTAEDAGGLVITHNNIGDIVTINASANAVVSSTIEQNVLSVLLGLLNQQAAVVATGQEN